MIAGSGWVPTVRGYTGTTRQRIRRRILEIALGSQALLSIEVTR